MADNKQKMLTVPDVANLFQVSDQHIYDLVKARRIRYFRFGRLIRFRLADLEDYIQANLSEPMAEPVGREVPRLPTPDEKG